jgi:hypothetical protein
LKFTRRAFRLFFSFIIIGRDATATITMASSKRIDPKKKQAYKSIVNLVNRLPSDKIETWLSVSELQSLLVNGGVQIDEDVLRLAMRYHSRGLFDSRRFGRRNMTYYRHSSCAGDPTTPDTRQPICLELPSDYFKGPDYQNDVDAIADFLCTMQSADNAPPFSKKRPVEDSNVDTLLPCRGWSGPTYQKLILLSKKDFLDQGFESFGTVPAMDQKRFPLSRVFINRKHYGEFVVEPDVMAASNTTSDRASMAYTIRATSCEGSPDGRRCPCCKQLSKSMEGINRQATKVVKIHGNMHLTPASVQLMGPNITAAAVSAIREKKDGQIQNLDRIIIEWRDLPTNHPPEDFK